MHFLKQLSENKLHTAIVKKVINEITYIVAIGYGGGGVFEEFCGKFWYRQEDEMVEGLFSCYHNPDEWEKRTLELDILEEPYMMIDHLEKAIIQGLVDELWETYIFYNEESDEYLISNKMINNFEEGVNVSADWDDQIVDFVSCNFWGLSLSFAW